MSYEEFWEKDYRLTESYIKKHDMDIDRETQSNWELMQYMRTLAWEVATAIHKDPKSSTKPIKFPDKPYSRTITGNLNEERNKAIGREIQYVIEQKEKDRKYRKSDDND